MSASFLRPKQALRAAVAAERRTNTPVAIEYRDHLSLPHKVTQTGTPAFDLEAVCE